MMNQEDLERAIIYGTEWLKDEYLDARDRAFIEIALEALEQMLVTTTAGEGGVIYYPQVEGVTPTVIDAGKQEPCDNCKYLDGDGCRLVFEQAEYGEASDECPNDNNELPSVNRKRCDDCIWSVCNYNKVDWESVTPQPKTGYWIYKQYDGYPECGNWHCSECDEIDNRTSAHCPNCGCAMVEPLESEEKENNNE